MADDLSPELYGALQDLCRDSPQVETLGREDDINVLLSVSPEGVLIETESTRQQGQPPQLLSADMLEPAWEHLRREGSLSRTYLRSSAGLNVKRSSVVCTLLARLPGVSVAPTESMGLLYQKPKK